MNKEIKQMVKISIVAALYAALTLFFQPISYGMVQFRISEVLMLLVFYNKKYTISLVIGCLISNVGSVYTMDIIFGTLATLISCLLMWKVKKRVAASFIPAIINGIVVGTEIFLMSKTGIYHLLLCIGSVTLCEIVVISLVGNLLFSFFEKNKLFEELISL